METLKNVSMGHLSTTVFWGGKWFSGLKVSFWYYSYVLESKDNISSGIYEPKAKYEWQVLKKRFHGTFVNNGYLRGEMIFWFKG